MLRFKQPLWALWLITGVLIATVPCFAAPILSGSVSYDSVTKLYTYAYTMDNTTGPATITELSVLIDSTTADFTLTPTSFTSPSGGWNFVTAVSGSSSLPPLNEFGTFWQWNSGMLPVGNSLSGFSFTTPYAPTPNLNNNYFVYSSFYNLGPPCCIGVVEYGHIVAPDIGTPEPSSMILLGTGLLILHPLRRRLMFRAGK